MLRLSLISVYFSCALLAASCEKEGTPSVEDLVGTWAETSPANDTLIFRSNRSLIKISSGVRDTLIFRPDGDDGTVTFTNPDNAGAGESVHKVYFMSNGDIMRLGEYRWNQGAPEDAMFKRL